MRATVAKRLPTVILVGLALAGLSISLYLVWSDLQDRPLVCTAFADCDYVNQSAYAKVGPVPVSLLGAGLFLVLIALGMAWNLRPQVDTIAVAFWGASLAGFGYAAYLTYIELAVLEAVCIWCLATAAILTLSTGLSGAVLLRSG